MPALLSEVALIGSAYTVADHVRRYFYQTTADFLHHVRSSLSFDMLANVPFIFFREKHDNLLSYQDPIGMRQNAKQCVGRLIKAW